jgi:predicted RNase H-like HicB family nuclease
MVKLFLSAYSAAPSAVKLSASVPHWCSPKRRRSGQASNPVGTPSFWHGNSRRSRLGRTPTPKNRLKLDSHSAYHRCMKRHFNAVIKRNQGWWIGWVEEIPGVNSQGKTRAELVRNLRSALKEALQLNRDEALAAAQKDYEEEPILV